MTYTAADRRRVMDADDPRHGSEAGYEQHLRDGEVPCGPCAQGDLIAHRRRSKRRTMGYVYQCPIGEAVSAKLATLRAQGATFDDIAAWSSITPSQAWRACVSDPDALVYARTWIKLNEFEPGPIYTSLGITRRLQAMAWMGYSAERIAIEVGCHPDTIRDALTAPREFLARKVKLPIVDAYERLCMTPAVGVTQQERAGVTRTKNRARRLNWGSPLSWDDIDHDEQPQGTAKPRNGRHASHTEARIADLEHFVGADMSLDEACRELGVTVDALWKWCDRHDRRDLYERLARGHRRSNNQHTARGAA